MKSSPTQVASPAFGLPRVPRSVVSRPRITELISSLLEKNDLVIIRAPSGAGKTVALADWVASGVNPSYISWLAMDERYATRTSFWREIFLAVSLRMNESVRPLIIECVDGLMAGADPRAVLRQFMPYIPETTLVIDRVDLVRDEELIQDMLWVLQHCRQLKGVLTARGRSLLDTAALSLSMDVAILESEPFQLTIEETQQLVSLRGLSMDTAALHAATGGHPLLTRATMTVYGQSGNASIGASVQTAVSDFLRISLEQSRLGPVTKDFMVRTSLPESFTLDLAMQMTGSDCVTEILDDLEDQGLGMWFKNQDTLRFQYTPAVRSLLQESLRTLDPRDIDRLTRIVIGYDLALGNVVNALRQATAIVDLDLASRIACDNHITLLISETKAVLDILEALPVSKLRRHPALIMALALCHNASSSGRVKALEYFGLAVAFAGMYKSSMDSGQRIWMLVLESVALRYAGKLELAVKYANRAVEGFEESPPELKEQLKALEPTLYDQAAMAHIHDQEFDTAADLLVKSLNASRRSGTGPGTFLTTSLLAFTLALDGRPIEARRHLTWLNESRWPAGMLEGYWATTYRMAQVREAMDRQSYAEAVEYLDLINDETQVSEFWTHTVWFRSLLDLQRDGTSVGPVTLEAKICKMHAAPLNSSGQIDLDCLRAVIHLVAGQPLKASMVVSKYTKPLPRVLIMRARIALYLENPAKALKLTSRSIDVLGPRMEVQRLMLHAAALERLGDRAAAKDNARAAGSMMSEYGLNITGALLPQSDIAVLTGYVHAGEPGIPDPVKIIPDKVEAASLTPRELVVLNSFAIHGSASEVASALNVSVNTVKSQRRSILKKLGAHSLENALQTARHQRLLED